MARDYVGWIDPARVGTCGKKARILQCRDGIGMGGVEIRLVSFLRARAQYHI